MSVGVLLALTVIKKVHISRQEHLTGRRLKPKSLSDY
jgi:hypothetical protein